MSEALQSALFVGLFVAVIWGALKLIAHWQADAHRRKVSLAWTFLTWTDDEIEQHRQRLLAEKNPGRYAIELEALGLSRQMREDLRGDLLSIRRSGS